VIGHEGLRERHFGSFQGLTWSEIQERWPDASLSWQQRDRWFNPGEGESLVVFGQRVVSAVHAIAGAHPGQHILLAAHGGVMDVLYRHANGLAIEAPRNWELGNAAINRLLWTPQSLTLVHWGDTSHLDGQAVLDESST